MSAPDSRDLRRLQDIDGSIRAINDYVREGDLSHEAVLDAVLYRLIVIGEAAKALSPATTESTPHIPWRTIGRARDHYVHHYFATVADIVHDTVTNHLPPLATAVTTLLAQLDARDAASRQEAADEHPPGGV